MEDIYLSVERHSQQIKVLERDVKALREVQTEIRSMNETLLTLANELKHTNQHLTKHEKKIEEIVRNIVGKNNKRPEIDDLVQMVYLILLEYDEDKIVNMYNKKQLIFFITRIVLNQFNSSNSPFLYIYRKWSKENLEFNTNINEENEPAE